MENKVVLFEIKKLFNQYDVRIPLDQPINIFLGENGMGKTTILNCIYCTLSGEVEKLYDTIFSEITITLSTGEHFTVNHEDIQAYRDFMYESSPYFRRHRFDLGRFLPDKEIQAMVELYNNNPQDYELRKFYIHISDMLDIPFQVAQQEARTFLSRFTSQRTTGKGNYNNAKAFNETMQEKINQEILYFPTYRRIEEDINKLGIDIEKKRNTSKLIKFGMSDVEDNIKELLQKIKTVAINGFTKMTAVLLKQYLDEQISDLNDYKIEENRLSIALSRIGEEIDNNDKERIIQLVNSNDIHNSENKYLLNLIKNLIDSYEKQMPYDERVKSFVSVCNHYLNDKKYDYDESNLEIGIYKENSKQQIDIQNLSSGEKQIISVFSKLYIEERKDCIILFDEPELSLSILWQKMFLPDIFKSGKCSTLIAVTHSPFIFDNEFDEYAKDMGSCLSRIN